MGTYKGNKGNLMQHWTLCEILRIAQCNSVTQLNYIDAHAMAPFAWTRTDSDAVFDRVRENLGKGTSTYVKAWCTLVRNTSDGYPSSANFLQHVWHEDFSMLLCEIRNAVADEIAAWMPGIRAMSNCKKAGLARGDWRDTFDTGLPSLGEMELAADALTVATFDPYMISTRSHRYCENKGNMYPQDIDRVARALESYSGGVLIQLSTYSSNGPTPQAEVKEMTDSVLGEFGWKLVGSTSANKAMMSLIYTRGVDWANNLESLGRRFSKWLSHYL